MQLSMLTPRERTDNIILEAESFSSSSDKKKPKYIETSFKGVQTDLDRKNMIEKLVTEVEVYKEE